MIRTTAFLVLSSVMLVGAVGCSDFRTGKMFAIQGSDGANYRGLELGMVSDWHIAGVIERTMHMSIGKREIDGRQSFYLGGLIKHLSSNYNLERFTLTIDGIDHDLPIVSLSQDFEPGYIENLDYVDRFRAEMAPEILSKLKDARKIKVTIHSKNRPSEDYRLSSSKRKAMRDFAQEHSF